MAYMKRGRERAPETGGGPTPESPALELVGVSKRYDDGARALEGLSLEVPRGSFFGLLGPNGAGKTTLIGAVANLVGDVSGQVLVFGESADSRPARSAIGLAEQENNLDGSSSVCETLVLHGRLFGMSRRAANARAVELIEQFGLGGRRAARAGQLSGGERRRLVLARALMHDPRLVILDEPTASVDVKQRTALWEHMRRIHNAGRTVLLTTHDLDEADALCDRVAFIEKGRLIAQGRVQDLCRSHGVDTLRQLYPQIVKEEL
jgi:ABC-2 type transport system ATP-binding protein